MRPRRAVVMVTHPHRADPKERITPTAMLAATSRQDSLMAGTNADSHDDTTAEGRKPAADQADAGQAHLPTTPHGDADDSTHESVHGAEDAVVDLTDAGDDEPIEPDPEAIERVVERIDAQPSAEDLRTPSAGDDGDAELLPIEPVTAPTNLMDDEAQVIASDDEAHDEHHDGHDEAAEKSMAACS